MIDIDKLAQEIRRVDGSNNLGAGALAEALMPFLEAIMADREKRVAVEPLEWFVQSNGMRAHSLIGHYTIDYDGPVFYVSGPSGSLNTLRALESAKAAAQADYKGRILSALSNAEGK